MKAWEHFKTITHHRHLVMKGCFAVGLYKQGLLHDLSKYSWTEFSVGAKYYQGFKSPNNAEREATGVSLAWLHHKGRNKHHLEYWIDYGIGEGEHGCMTGMEMPVKYVVEMYCDRVAACKTYQKDAYTNRSALEYYEKGKGKYMMHANTAKLLENMLTYLAEHGEAATNDYIRREILKNKK
ncbi:hypothetical protein SAMN04487831_101342 [Pseudobutyrivibrio sp. UC1225]|uniref:DUF5662 family protein n=1 Tax=Pseudobutyrivibrio sp. UC1225 TaxID=1798185 RepID=UPI0008E1290C|nr:DUF5662 family protein [Pseudobutyrivibrio sp. UC1225]SFN47624.1 hypothetical protein SAMN04487831_101342 [Pseudobutyrivibrio sp. UC1225]